jgi:hypothetical protein
MTSPRPAFPREQPAEPDQIFGPRTKQTPTDEFASLTLARAYIDTVRQGIGSLGLHELIDALQGLDRAYHQFPELVLDHPRGELLEALQSAAENMRDRTAVPLLIYCLASAPACSSSVNLLVEKVARSNGWQSVLPILRILSRSREICGNAISPLAKFLHEQDRADMLLPIISEVLGSLTFASEESTSEFADILTSFLTEEPRPGGGGCALANVARSARRRVTTQARGRNVQGSGADILPMAERLRLTLSAARPNRNVDAAWPSGSMSFDEFLLQWPCEIELPDGLDDPAFIEEAYRAILLRPPQLSEKSQYLRLMKDGVFTKSCIIEDLLACEEFLSLERRLRVVCDGHVITEPGSSGQQEMPTVMWPLGSPN